MKRILFYIKESFLILLRVLFSFISSNNSCAVCGKKTLFIPLCKSCAELHFGSKIELPVKVCRVCGKELISENDICMHCRKDPVLKSVTKNIPLYSYRLWNKELLFLWKIGGNRNLSYFFALLFAKRLEAENIEYLVPVPPRPGKIQEKGWDQMDEVSRILEFRYGYKILHLLKRISDFQQKKLGRVDRLSKTNSSYVLCEENHLNKIKNQYGGKLPEKVCIIDDVCTTGVTLETCAGLLRKLDSMGIKQIYSMTLFIVD